MSAVEWWATWISVMNDRFINYLSHKHYYLTFGTVLAKVEIPSACCKPPKLQCTDEEAAKGGVKGCEEFITQSTDKNMKMVMYIWIGAMVLQVGTDALKKNNLF